MEKPFYVYIYLDPRKKGDFIFNDLKFEYEPFYVGKGKGNRINFHIWKSKEKSHKNNKIKKILKEGLKPITLKLYENLSEEESFKKETETIKKIGRLDNNTGCLCNKTDGGEGHSGLKQSDETKNKRIESLKKSSFYETVKSEKFRKKMSEIVKNNFKNESTINKLRDCKLGSKNPQYGKTTSDKQKEIVKELHKKGKIVLSDNGRKKIIENSKKRKGKKNKNIRCDVIKYNLKSPTNETFIIYGARKLQEFCSQKNIRYHILKKNINISINNKHINNSKSKTSLNTIGWIITKN